MDSQALELARESVGRTRREHTAELWYRDNFTFLRDWREWADEDRQTGEAHPELVWDWLNHGLHSAAPAGRIEFDRDRALYSTGDEWRLSVDGNLYSGEPGDWEEDERDAPMSEAEPHWLLAIAEACVEAEAVSSLDVHGEDWWCLKARCDFGRVASGRQIIPPQLAVPTLASKSEPLDLARLHIDLWLDGQGRIRRSMFFKGRLRTILELSGFGTPGPIDSL
jgi:hypothetical protein